MDWKEFENEPTEDLIEMIRWQSKPEDLETAHAAFKAFFFRFRDDVVKTSRIVSKNWGYDNDVADTIAEQTFDRFWKKPFTFDSSKCTTPNIDKCVKLYLFSIAKHLLADYTRHINGHGSAYSGDEEVIMEFPEIENLDFPDETRRDMKKMLTTIQGALDRLSPKHKIIYLTYRAYEKVGYKLPRTLLVTLRKELDLTQNSIRVYKKEAFETVDTYLKLYGNK